MSPTAWFAFDEACDTDDRPVPTAGMAAAEKLASPSCICVVRPDTVCSASDAVPRSARMRQSASFAPPTLACASSVADSMPASESRASLTVCTAWAIFSTACERDASSFSRDSPSAWSMASAATSLTVETNVELMVSSSVLAPVSVIFGATGPAFSFTKYSSLGCVKSPVVSESSCEVKSAGITNAA